MDSTTTATTPAAADHGGGTPITSIHSDIIQSHILNRLDGPTLASTSCASAQLFSLCSEDHLWRSICNSAWPSTTHPTVRRAIAAFPSGHRSFYSDSFPAVRCRSPGEQSEKGRWTRVPETSEFISAVDIYCDEKLVYSKVLVTETLSGWFLSSPFRIDLLEPKETVPTPLKYDGEEGACMELAEDRLRVSWILIDPTKKRAVNVASLKAVEARRHWLTEDIQLRFATVMAGDGGELVQCGVVMTCGGKDGGELQVREVSMQMEDMEGRILAGIDSLVILDEAMEGRRRKSDGETEKAIYESFMSMRVECRERKQRRERGVDIICITGGVSIFLAIWMIFFWR
ncbi:F-box protein [Sesamum alatum]|uniref:F-box protein n=1 Tax=Sesamum alatum TaxID=300844 RepID=A0AAE1Z303_9LAMI|nr:F-box protein [Sesamum alatum]